MIETLIESLRINNSNDDRLGGLDGGSQLPIQLTLAMAYLAYVPIRGHRQTCPKPPAPSRAQREKRVFQFQTCARTFCIGTCIATKSPNCVRKKHITKCQLPTLPTLSTPRAHPERTPRATRDISLDFTRHTTTYRAASPYINLVC
jgi:hypothetical protein